MNFYWTVLRHTDSEQPKNLPRHPTEDPQVNGLATLWWDNFKLNAGTVKMSQFTRIFKRRLHLREKLTQSAQCGQSGVSIVIDPKPV